MSIMFFSWTQFRLTNFDGKSIQLKFEDLCRQLFMNEFLGKNKVKHYLHANPNNAGLETEPIFCEESNKSIGFQAKFFEDRVDYRQIMESANKIVSNYSGSLDTLYLFCNKDISRQSRSFQKISNLLAEYGIDIELITNDSILDLVKKYHYLSVYYFGTCHIDSNWLIIHNQQMFLYLHDRFNESFNIATDASKNLSFFVKDDDAIQCINERKRVLLKKIDQFGYDYHDYSYYINLMRNTLINIEDIDYINFENAFRWQQELQAVLETETNDLAKQKDRLKESLVDCDQYNRYEKEKEIEKIDDLLSLTSNVGLTDFEMSLLSNKVLIIKGEAGTGKSQLFANETAKFISSDRKVLLLLAGFYADSRSLENQIMEQCRLNFDFEKLIDIFESIGEVERRFVPIFIDALNETWNNGLWKQALPRIIKKINDCNYVKLAISFRSEYERQILDNKLINPKNNPNISYIVHNGFENNTEEAVQAFFNHYGIKFPLEYFLEYKFDNPFFLTLYCKNYQGDEPNLPQLYDRILAKADQNLQCSLPDVFKNNGYTEYDRIVYNLIICICSWIVKNGNKYIDKESLIELSFWKEYRLPLQPIIRELEREKILYSYLYLDKEFYFLAYDQMNDYYCAKAIVDKARSRDEIKEKIKNDILEIKDGKIKKYSNVDLFINVCVLFTEKYHEECIDVIDFIDNKYYKLEIAEKYVSSYMWRSKESISFEYLLSFISKYSIENDLLCKVFIANSLKKDHPLNADKLHECLIFRNLNQIDYLWTININKFFSEESRLYQLINIFIKGEKIDIDNKQQKMLLLTLFAWLLSASNRRLRDLTSKAMVEILKIDFELSLEVLKKFHGVHDPYIIQRLYGVVFGACCKRENDFRSEYENLVEYVYTDIFNNSIVCPDILLRDYARLIIERFLWEYKDYNGIINKERIIPPYKSFPIPEIREDYTNFDSKERGLSNILWSMQFNLKGFYGDFGRYVFQSALNCFDVNEENIFNCAVDYIINHLNYKEDWFSAYDYRLNMNNVARGNTIKTERIGKKYQWIAMHNILARITDYSKMLKEPYTSNPKERYYEGPWEPFVRDFDPTINENICNNDTSLRFTEFDSFNQIIIAEDKLSDFDTINNDDWAKDDSVILDNMSKIILLDNENMQRWVALGTYISIEGKKINNMSKRVFLWTHAYFVSETQQEEIIKASKDNLFKFESMELLDSNMSYKVFNREYPWAPSCKVFKENELVELLINTGEERKFTRTLPKILYEWKGSDNSYFDNPQENLYETNEWRIPVKRSIGKILRAYSELSLENEYDASKFSSKRIGVACSKFIEMFNLEQKEYDGIYYDENGEIATFDTNNLQNSGGVVVRKDLLERFLQINHFKLIWFIGIGKEAKGTNEQDFIREDFHGVLFYDKKDDNGSCIFLPIKNLRRNS